MTTSRTIYRSLFSIIVLAAVLGGVKYFAFPTKLPEAAKAGAITGSTSYPSEFNPAQDVCAQSTTDATWSKCVHVPEQVGKTVPTFSIPVPSGKYYVYALVANPADLGLDTAPKAYWTAFVPCGMTTACKDHSKMEVDVGSGETVTGVNPQDWFTDY